MTLYFQKVSHILFIFESRLKVSQKYGNSYSKLSLKNVFIVVRKIHRIMLKTNELSFNKFTDPDELSFNKFNGPDELN
jgi:hypothetical protein